MMEALDLEYEKLVTPLLLVDASGGAVYGRTRIQKMMFLAQQESEFKGDEFEYFAWDYGPYSKELQQYLDVLVDLSFLRETAEKAKEGYAVYKYEITKAGRTFVQEQNSTSTQNKRKALVALSQAWNRVSLEELIRHVYAAHPDFAVKSKYGAT
jgi:uncharacterized protein YwgA